MLGLRVSKGIRVHGEIANGVQGSQWFIQKRILDWGRLGQVGTSFSVFCTAKHTVLSANVTQVFGIKRHLFL